MRNRLRREPTPRTPASFDEADVDLIEVLDALEQAKNYSSWILDLIGPHISGRILEVGATTGSRRCSGSGMPIRSRTSRRSRLGGFR